MSGEQPEHGERRTDLVRQIEALRHEVSDARYELREHIREEMPPLRAMLQELGDPEDVRARRVFVEAWIEREKDRAALRKAIIEKGLLMALVAVLSFVAIAIGHELAALAKDFVNGNHWGGKP